MRKIVLWGLAMIVATPAMADQYKFVMKRSEKASLTCVEYFNETIRIEGSTFRWGGPGYWVDMPVDAKGDFSGTVTNNGYKYLIRGNTNTRTVQSVLSDGSCLTEGKW